MFQIQLVVTIMKSRNMISFFQGFFRNGRNDSLPVIISLIIHTTDIKIRKLVIRPNGFNLSESAISP